MSGLDVAAAKTRPRGDLVQRHGRAQAVNRQLGFREVVAVFELAWHRPATSPESRSSRFVRAIGEHGCSQTAPGVATAQRPRGRPSDCN
jgi:hypothetical protein